jgi:hypothetical protein
MALCTGCGKILSAKEYREELDVWKEAFYKECGG